MGGVVCDASERAILRRSQDSQSTTDSRTAQGREVASKLGLNRCPFQRLREGYRKDTKRTRVRSDRNAAFCRRPTTNVSGPLHECKKVAMSKHKSPTQVRHSRMNQARLEEEVKKRGRETGKTEARRLIERKAAQQNKNLSEELKLLKQGLPRHSSG